MEARRTCSSSRSRGLRPTLSNFGKWLIYSRSTLFWLAWPGALVFLRRDRRAWELSAIAAAAAVPYLFYLVFDNWDSSRFLLPTIVLVLIVCARALSQFLNLWTTQAGRAAVLFAIAFTSGFVSQQFLQREGIGRTRVEEAKYALVGEWFRQNTSERAVVLSSLHSGAIRTVWQPTNTPLGRDTRRLSRRHDPAACRRELRTLSRARYSRVNRRSTKSVSEASQRTPSRSRGCGWLTSTNSRQPTNSGVGFSAIMDCGA